MGFFGDAWDWTKEAVEDTGEWIGDAIGTSKTDTSGISAETDEARKIRADLAARLAAQQGRPAPQVNPAEFRPGVAPQIRNVNVNPAAHAQATSAQAGQIGPVTNAVAGTAGPVAQVGATQVGAGTPMNAANVRNAAMAGTAQIDSTREGGARAGQERLASSLEMAANGQGGPSAAEAMLGRSLAKQTAAQHALAAGARGASAGRALRTAQINTGNLQAESAGQLAAMRAQEQLSARGQLAGALQGMRSTDVDVAGQQAQLNQQSNVVNAGAQNQVNLAAMSNEQGANQFNANAEAERRKLQATLDQQRGIVNAGATNEAGQAQAGRDTTVGLANADAANSANTTQAGLNTSVSVANAGNATDVSKTNATTDNTRAGLVAGLDLQVQKANADITSQFAIESGRIGLQAATANMDAALRARGLDDAQIQALIDAQLKASDLAMGGEKAIAGVQQDDKAGRRQFVGGLMNQIGAAVTKPATGGV